MKKFLKHLMLVALLCVPWITQAQTHYNVQVGYGTEQYQYVPNYTYYNYSYSQSLYTASEIGINGTIDTLAFQVVEGGATRSLTIFMAEVSQTSLSSQVSASDLTEVFHGSVTWAQGWVYIPLSTTFNYQDTGSLVIAILDSTGTYASGYPYFAGATLSGTRARYIYQDGSPYDASTPMTSTTGFLPNVILGMTSDAIYCATPGNVAVTNIDFDSAHISWTENGNATAWELIVSDTVVSDFENAGTIPVSSTNYTIQGLNGNTPYYVYVRASCGSNSYSGWTSAIYFRSACMGYTTLPYSTGFEDAENGMPNCWYNLATGTSSSGSFPSTYNYATNARNGDVYFEFESNTGATEIAVLPLVDAINTLQLQFYAACMNTNFTLEVGVVEDSLFVPIDTVALTAGAGNNWHNSYYPYTVYFDQYTGSAERMAMRVTALGSYTLMIDDITIDEIPSCLPPSHLNIDSIGNNWIGLSWTDEIGSSWEVLYDSLPINLNNINVNPVTVDETSVVLTNLAVGNEYTVYVRTDCGGDYSPWIGPLTFTAGSYNMRYAGSDTLRGCGFIVYDDGGANDEYTTGASSTVVIYPTSEDSLIVFNGTSDIYSYYANLRIFDGVGTSGSILWQSTSDMETIPTITSFSGPITIVWNAGNYNYGYTGFEINTSCISAPQCASVQNIQVPTVSTTSAYVSWEVSGLNLGVPSAYEVECYDTTNTMVFTEQATTTHSMITGLIPANTYTVKVRTVCDGNEYGALDSLTFNTLSLACVEIDASTAHYDTIGNGTTTSSYVPTYTCYNYSISQQVYTADELNGAGDLSSISFMPSSIATPNGASRNIEIYAAHVSGTISGFTYPTDLTLVYSGTQAFTADQWCQINFDNTFNYNGTDNLMIMFRDLTGAYSCSNSWYVHTASSGSSVYDYRDASAFPLGYTGGSTTSNRMNAVLGFATCSQLATCAAPVLVVDSVATDYVGISWAAGYQETSWIVEHRHDTSDVWVTDGTTSSTSWTYPNLDPNSRYHFRVGAVCSDTTIFAYVSVLTKCDAELVPFATGFEDYPSSGYPSCWYAATTYSYGSYPAPSTTYVHGGAQSLYMYSGSGTYTYVVLPEMNANIDTLEVSFWMYATSASNTNELYVGVMTDAENFNTFQTVGIVTSTAASIWESFKVRFDNYHGNGTRIAIVSPQSSYVNLYIDDLSVNMIRPCSAPENFTLVNATTDSAIIAWGTTGNSQFDVVYGPSGFILDSGTFVTTTVDTVVLGGLTANTQYDVYVRTFCSDGDTSNWSSAFSFRTDCEAITSIPFTEGFENNAPGWSDGSNPNFYPCWYRANTPGASYYYPYVYSYTSHSGNNGLYWDWDSYNAFEPYIALPAIDTNIIDISDLQLSFWAYAGSGASYGDFPVIIIGTMTNPQAITTFQPLDTVSINTTDWYKYEIPLSAYNGNGEYIALLSGNTGNYWYGYFDDFTLDTIPSCPHVQNLASTGNTASTVDLTWTEMGSATTWDIAYDTDPAATPVADTTVTSSTATVNGLTTGTTYYFWVRAVCSTTDMSTWEGPIAVVPGSYIMQPNMTDTVYMCGGVITDDGGINGTYSSSQNSYVIIRPETPGSLIMVDGSSYTESTYDHLHIYDGEGVSGTELWNDYGVSTLQSFGPFISSTGSITLYFESDGSVNYDGFQVNVSCVSNPCPIENLAQDINVIASDALAVTWTGSAQSYEVAYGPTGIDIDSATIFNTTTNSATITGLAPVTTYDIYVRALCNSGDTGLWMKVVLTTALCDGSIEVLNYVDSTQSTSTSSYSPIGYSYYNYSYVQTIIPAERLTDLTGEINAFAFNPANTTAGTHFTNMTVWMANVTESDLSAGYILPDANHVFVKVVDSADFSYNSTGWQIHGFDSAFTWDGTSNILFAVHREHGTYTSGSTFNAHVDTVIRMRYSYQDSGPYDYTSITGGNTSTTTGDIKFISCGAACSKPNLTNVTNLSYDGATLNWISNATEFEVAVKAATDADYPTATPVSNATSYTVTGLTPATMYRYHVRAICDEAEGDFSDWVEGTFTTDSLPCFDPSELAVQATGYTTVTLGWTANGEETNWRIHVWNTAFDTTYDVTSNPATVGGLAPDVDYNAEVMALCGTVMLESGVSNTVTIHTAMCEVPTGVTVSNVTAHTAVVSWTGNAQSYRVTYGYEGFGTGNEIAAIPVTGTTTTLTGLESGETYDVYVYAVCETGIESNASTKTTFETDIEGISTADGMNVSIYPNPTTDATTIALSGVNGEVSITIVDMNGRIVKSDSMSCEGDCTKRMEVNGLAQGAYFVRINGEGLNMVKKLVVK